jgi:uncharacterized protein YrrD
MQQMEQLVGVKVYVPAKKAQVNGVPAAPKRIGKVHNLVFSPNGHTVVGIMVKRPDVAGVVKREDTFVALDSLQTYEKGLLVAGDGDGDAATDAAAVKRLGLDFDACIMWGGMDVVTRSGDPLGYVIDVTFDMATGAVDTFYVSDGELAASLAGSLAVPASMVVGYAHSAMVVEDEAKNAQVAGGVAAVAGEGFAKAKAAGKSAAHEAGVAAGKAVDKGSFALGKALGTARAAMRDAMTEDPEVPEVPAQNVQVEAIAAPAGATSAASDPAKKSSQAVAAAAATAQAAGDSNDPAGFSAAGASSTTASGEGASTSQGKKDMEVPTYVPAGTAGAPAAPYTEEAHGKEASQVAEQAARAVGKQLGKTKGALSGFMKAFKEASE